jgi:hypothetical protein
MYKIIGGDQKEYGPATAEELRAWIAEGRLSGQSLVQVEGCNEWKPLGKIPEFAEALGAQSSWAQAGTEGPRPIGGPVSNLSNLQPQVQIGSCLGRSAKLLAENFGLLFGACFLVWSISFLAEFHYITLSLFAVLRGVFYGGLYLVFLKRIRGQPASVGEVFAGFGVSFSQLLLTGFIGAFVSWIGCCFCLLPGIYLFVAWTFGVPLAADRRLEFWSALESSRKVVSRVWFEVFALLVLAFLPFVLANTIAVASHSMAVLPVWKEFMAMNPPDLNRLKELMARMPKPSFVLTMVAELVYLLNLPFALGALMYAYEDLFGTRSGPTA